jgi:hypothetical protein
MVRAAPTLADAIAGTSARGDLHGRRRLDLVDPRSRRRPVRARALIAATTLGLIFAWALASIPEPREDVAWGATFSPRYVRSLGLDPQAVYVEMLDGLRVRRVRLPLYWDEVEPSPGDYDFSALDWYLGGARARGADLLLVVGYKQPRWPECYPPIWAADLPTDRLRERILGLVEAEVAHARAYPNVTMWQVENEPFRRYGECRGPELLTPDFLTEEIRLVKRLDGRPVLVTDSGELSSWIPAMRLPGDQFGTTAYRQLSFRTIGFWQHPLPAWSYPAKDRVVRGLLRKEGETILVELQAEPWFEPAALADIPPERQAEEFPEDLLLGANVDYARRIGFSHAYLWGVEWWFWMQAQGYPSYVEAARPLFRR